MKGFLVLETGEIYQGRWHGGSMRTGEVVFNTSHAGYEEIATDPSYFSQIMVMTAPMQGNYGSHPSHWESSKVWIEGFVCLEIHTKGVGAQWTNLLLSNSVPILSGVDTRSLTLRLRSKGTPWAAILNAEDPDDARARAKELLLKKRKSQEDWTLNASVSKPTDLAGGDPRGPRVAVIDFGSKRNILNSVLPSCSEMRIFPSDKSAAAIREWNPNGIILSNGPGDPAFVEGGVQTIRELLGWKPMFGICMGHQVLGQALGAKTFKLKFGHRGGNHPVRDYLLNRISVTSQNHGYAILGDSLPSDVRVTHVNLNDDTIEGIECASKKCFSVQFHPESAPGPHEAGELFKLFMDRLK